MKLMNFAVLALFAGLLVFALGDVTAAHAASGALLASDPSTMMHLIGGGLLGRLTMAQMREKRNETVKKMRDMLDKKGDAQWKPEETAAYDALDNQVQSLDGDLAREQRLLDLTADKNFRDAGGRELPADQQASRDLYNKWLRGGDNALNAAEWAQVRNTMSTTTPSEGGFTVQTEVAKELIEALKEYGGMREAAEVFSTSQGNPLSYPTSDGTAEVGELIAENASATSADPTFGTVSLNAYKFSSKIIAVPIELLQDSSINMEAFVRARIAERLGRITNQLFTTGTGTAQPRGIVTGASAGKVGTTGQTVTITYDDLVDLQHAVDPAYRKLPGTGFMLSDTALKVIRKIKDGSQRPIFVPGYESNVPGGVPDTLLGSTLIVNNDVPVMAANAKSILFGNLKKYKVRDVMGMSLFRFTDSAYTKLGQVGFLAWMRSGGNLVDTSAVKYYQNSAA